jgi:uncharacterized membrane protein (UPF0127 family)
MLVGLILALSMAGYFMAGQILSNRSSPPRPLPVPENIVTVATQTRSVDLAVFKVIYPRQLEAFRPYLKPDSGILYRFPQARDDGWTGLGFKNAVSVAFLDSRGKILTILDIEPCPAPLRGRGCRSYVPGVVYRQVLEVSRGWFVQNEVGPGAMVRVKLPESGQ